VHITDSHSHPHFLVNKVYYLLCKYDIPILSTVAGIAPCTAHICTCTPAPTRPRAPARPHHTPLPARLHNHTPACTCLPAPTRARAPARLHPHARTLAFTPSLPSHSRRLALLKKCRAFRQLHGCTCRVREGTMMGVGGALQREGKGFSSVRTHVDN
jgi:hypothetical protein